MRMCDTQTPDQSTVVALVDMHQGRGEETYLSRW